MLRHYFHWFTRSQSKLKKTVNYVFWTFVIIGLYLGLFASQTENMEHAGFHGLMALLTAVCIAVPSFFFLRTWVEKIYNIYLIVSLEAIVTIALVLNAFGALGLYRLGIGYDSFLHFFNSGIYTALCFFVGYMLMERYWLKVNKPALFWFSIVIVFIVGLLWEEFEVVGDNIFGTLMSSDPYALESHNYDTLKDIVYNILGSFTGAVAVSLYGERWLLGLKNQHNWKKFVKMVKKGK